MKPLSRWTIRATLTALALCAMVPALCIVAYFGIAELGRTRHETRNQAIVLAQTLAAQQTLLTESTRLLLTVIAGMPELRDKNTRPAEEFFRTLLRGNPNYAAFFLTDANGACTVTTSPDPDCADMPNRKYVVDALRQRAFSAGEYVPGKSAPGDMYHFAMPVFSDRAVITGVVGTAILVSVYDRLFSRISVPPGARLILHDHQGIRLYRYPRRDDFPLGKPANIENRERIEKSQADFGVFDGQSLDGQELYYGFVKLRLDPNSPPYMTVLAAIPRPNWRDHLMGGFGRSMGLLLAALLVALVIARTLGSAAIGTGVDALVRAAGRLSSGDMAARAGAISACNEIVQLGSAFDSMAAGLASRETERLAAEIALRASELRFRQVFERSPAGIMLFDSKGVITACNTKLAEMMGADCTDMIVGIDMPARMPDGPVKQSVLATIERGEAQYEGPYTSISGGRELVIRVVTREISSGVYMAMIEDLTERVRAEESIRHSLAEKTTLLREVHHRVKNNLQIITSLINLQTARMDDPAMREAFALMQGRVRSMAMIHDRLYRSESFSAVDMGEHLRELVSRIASSYTDAVQRVRLIVNAQSLPMSIDLAVPCGLLVNELVTNAFKHAFAEIATGTLSVSLRRQDADAVLEIADNGPGLPAGFDIRAAQSMGMQLVYALVSQLKGAIEVEAGMDGTRFRVTFPAQD